MQSHEPARQGEVRSRKAGNQKGGNDAEPAERSRWDPILSMKEMGAALLREPVEATEPSYSRAEEKEAWKDALIRSQSRRDFLVQLGWKMTEPIEAGHSAPHPSCA